MSLSLYLSLSLYIYTKSYIYIYMSYTNILKCNIMLQFYTIIYYNMLYYNIILRAARLAKASHKPSVHGGEAGAWLVRSFQR